MMDSKASINSSSQVFMRKYKIVYYDLVLVHEDSLFKAAVISYCKYNTFIMGAVIYAVFWDDIIADLSYLVINTSYNNK